MPMLIVVQRETSKSETTLGKMYINGKYFCETLEDQVRPDGVKVYGRTAIAAGTYKVSVTMSSRFKKELPLLDNVKNFSGVRIHGGNTSSDTLGCILVGQVRGKDRISNCAAVVTALTELIKTSGSASLTIRPAI